MTGFLRTVSTRQLLAALAGAVIAIAGGTAIAVAASGGGPVPPRSSLARAIHKGLTAPAVNGISARVSFSNHLIDASDIQGTDPLLQGGSGRLWISSDHRIRLELQSDNGDAQALVSNGSFWVYDPGSKTAYEGKLPAQSASTPKASKHKSASEKVPSVAKIQSQLSQAMRHLLISGAIPGDIASRPEYTVRVSPKRGGGLLGAVQLAWDSQHGVPLRVAVYARGDSSPVLELKVTDISYGRVSSSVFKVSPPAGSKVQSISATSSPRHTSKAHAKKHAVNGAAAVARDLSFRLAAPRTLSGLGRQSVTLIGSGRRAGALVTYGQGLGGVAVLEQVAQPTHSSQTQSSSGDRNSLSIPTISVNGVTAQQLQTALGTVVSFTRAGVSYTVLGSLPASTVDAAARGL